MSLNSLFSIINSFFYFFPAVYIFIEHYPKDLHLSTPLFSLSINSVISCLLSPSLLNTILSTCIFLLLYSLYQFILLFLLCCLHSYWPLSRVIVSFYSFIVFNKSFFNFLSAVSIFIEHLKIFVIAYLTCMFMVISHTF